MNLTRRVDINIAISGKTDDFMRISTEVIKSSRIINDVNYNLKNLTRKTAIDWLSRTIDAACMARKNWILLRKILNDIIFNLDWYISRCKIDLERYRDKPDDGE